MSDPALGATRLLSTSEQVRVLKNHIAYLEDDIGEKELRVQLLIDDNAEIDFLLALSERPASEDALEQYRRNCRRIESLRDEIERARRDVRTYRRVLVERYGEAV